jgi:sodium-dependent dicarboxylate transporter 2/3/5
LTTATDNSEASTPPSLETYQVVGRVLGPAIFLLFLATDEWQTAMSTEAWRVAAVGLWMAVWWATEAIPVPVTAFLPLIIFEPLGIASMSDAAAPYANPII